MDVESDARVCNLQQLEYVHGLWIHNPEFGSTAKLKDCAFQTGEVRLKKQNCVMTTMAMSRDLLVQKYFFPWAYIVKKFG